MIKRVACFVLTCSSILGMLPAPPASAAKVDVTVSDLQFTPRVVYVQPTDSVNWVRAWSGAAHNIVADDASFTSGAW